ncbi:hypothetical protein QYE76_015799 [Lolium multiflorum]|uniref:Uncharacterized protein n=1 Tax=Lolium multiflorum TaxID=4521 RepID=A0AAD8U7K1_LOLMU|nr:hypothetical protein QYE76_015799 [Lolium multiflorum]
MSRRATTSDGRPRSSSKEAGRPPRTCNRPLTPIDEAVPSRAVVGMPLGIPPLLGRELEIVVVCDGHLAWHTYRDRRDRYASDAQQPAGRRRRRCAYVRSPLADPRDKVAAFRSVAATTLDAFHASLGKRASTSAARELLELPVVTSHVVSKL